MIDSDRYLIFYFIPIIWQIFDDIWWYLIHLMIDIYDFHHSYVRILDFRLLAGTWVRQDPGPIHWCNPSRIWQPRKQQASLPWTPWQGSGQWQKEGWKKKEKMPQLQQNEFQSLKWHINMSYTAPCSDYVIIQSRTLFSFADWSWELLIYSPFPTGLELLATFHENHRKFGLRKWQPHTL